MYTLITEHQRDKRAGWLPKRTMMSDDPRWGDTERMWIMTMLDEGDDTLTIGDTMFTAQWSKTEHIMGAAP